jgi:hypothetical protein
MMPYAKTMNEETTTPPKTKCKKPKNTFQTLFSTMTRKPILKRTLAIVFIILVLYALFNTFFQPTDSSTFDSVTTTSTFPFNSGTTTTSSVLFASGASNFPSVKVYLYDLPERFTYGVIRHHSLARGGSRADENDVKYPGHQHMAEWYLFTDLSRPDSERPGSPVVRVLDPEEADLFFVPFFSSLSLIVNPIRPPGSGSDPEKNAYSDEENQEALMVWLEKQEYWKRSYGRDHVIVASDPNAMYRVVDRVKNCVLLLSDFGRLRPDQGSLVKDVIVPYSHRIKSYGGDVGVDKRNTLLFFMGNRYRKEVM